MTAFYDRAQPNNKVICDDELLDQTIRFMDEADK